MPTIQQVFLRTGSNLALLALAIMLILATDSWGEAHNIALIVGWVVLVLMAVFHLGTTSP